MPCAKGLDALTEDRPCSVLNGFSSFINLCDGGSSGLLPLWYAGPALGIGRGCDGLGPLPVGAQKIFIKGCIQQN